MAVSRQKPEICQAGPYFAAMAKKQVSAAAPAPANRPPYMLIEEIRVHGYKSLVDATLHVRPLTLLAGTNSSGKSSIMQPLLLIKQTMEANYNPASSLVLDGAHVQAETAGELVSKIGGSNKVLSLSIRGEERHESEDLSLEFESEYTVIEDSFLLSKQTLRNIDKDQEIELTPQMSWADAYSQLSYNITVSDSPPSYIIDESKPTEIFNGNGELILLNGFLELKLAAAQKPSITIKFSHPIVAVLGILMHIPALRILPKRTYPHSALQEQIKGTFDLYAAGTVSQWQEQQDTEKLAKLNDYLRRLGLTDSVTAKVKNANEVELSVSRLPAGSKGKPRKADMVNIADVGIGVSQVLPILVALIAAQEGQIVYVEQPELHLHPRAQVAMAELLAEAANRGVRVIVETHSSLLLLTVQTLIAQNRIKNTDVALHWFARDAKGATTVEYIQPDEDGAYGTWPEDFGDVELKAQDAYLTAVGERHFGNAAN